MPKKSLKEIFGEYEQEETQISQQTKRPLAEILDETQPPIEKKTDLTLPITAGVGAGAIGAYKGIESYIQRPQRKLIAPLEQQFENWRRQYPAMQGIRSVDFPQVIRGQMQEIKGRYAQTESNVSLATNRLQNRVNNLKTTVLNSNIEDLAMLSKTQLPVLFNDVYKGWEMGTDAIELLLQDTGKTYTNTEFGSFLDDILAKGEERGLNPNQLNAIQKVKDRILPEIEELTERKPLSFKRIQNEISNLKKVTKGGTRYLLQEEWSNFLERTAPKEVSQQVSFMNKGYKEFAEFRNEITSKTKMSSGKFNTEGFKKYFADFAENQAQQDKQAVIKMLTEGTPTVTPVAGLKGKVEILTKTAKQIVTLDKALDNIKNFSLKQKQNLMQKIESMTQWSNKATEILSKQAKIAEKYPIRLGGLKKALQSGAGTLGRTLIFRGIPGVALGTFMVNPPGMEADLAAIDRAISGRKPTEEEIKQALKDYVL